MSISVDLIDHMGSDLSVVNAARVSFDKASEYRMMVGDQEVDGPYYERLELSERDTRLIKYLADHNHWSPFAHAMASFRISAPVFVARQLQKHTVGLAWNEVSRRYVDTEPSFYTPETWRKRAENVKQGSSDEAVTAYLIHTSLHVDTVHDEPGNYDGTGYENEHINDLCLSAYHKLLEVGVCPEQARMVLPQSMMTQWIWSGSLMAFARVCKLRLDSHAQRETQEVAKGISDHMVKLFPVSWEVLLNV